MVQVLGDHIDQKGSIVQPERLRFDFSHGSPIDGPTLGKIEAICNQQLAADYPIFAKDVALSKARNINGNVSVPPQFSVACSRAEQCKPATAFNILVQVPYQLEALDN